MSSSKPSFKELLEKGEVVEVTSIGTICGLEKYEYCIREKCEYWGKEKRQCTLFVWISIMYEGKYHTLIMRREKAKENMKIARFLK
mgnify:FL=1